MLSEPNLPARARLRAQTALAWVRTHLGHGEEACAFLEDAAASEPDPIHAAQLRLAAGLALWFDGRESEAEEFIRDVRAVLRGAGGFRAGVLAPLLAVGLMASLANFEEAEEALVDVERALHAADDVRTRIELMGIRGHLLCERGERLRGVEELRAARRECIRSGYRVALYSNEVLLADGLLLLGRRAEALALLEETQRQATACGMQSALRMAARAMRRSDPLAMVREALPDKAERRPARVLAMAALREARAGDSNKVRVCLERLEAETAGGDFAVERALGAVAAWLVADRSGKLQEAERELARAKRLAGEGGADADLVDSMVQAVNGMTIVPNAPRARHVVIDRDTHEVRTDQGVISLKRRRVLRRLLYALSLRPGHVISRDDLVAEVWSARYHPRIHDNVLLVSVTRLRSLIACTGMQIEVEDDGFRLVW